MKSLYSISAVSAVVIFGYIVWAFFDAIHTYANQQPKEAVVSEHYQFVRCPDCHIERRPPSECGHETQGWAWDACVQMENRYREGKDLWDEE